MLEKWKPQDIKQCSRSELNVLCDEVRNVIYETVMQCGGHLASNLGAVEPTWRSFMSLIFRKIKSYLTSGISVMPISC